MSPAARVLVALVGLLCVCTVAVHADEATSSSRLRKHFVRGVEFVVDFEVTAERLAELAGHVHDVREQVTADLGILSSDQPLRFYLFGTQREFSRYVQKHIPSVDATDTLGRHGIFLQRRGNAYVFLVDHPELIASLRHECVHVMLNGAFSDTPIWIDEGLAQCYENPDGTRWSQRAYDKLCGSILRRSPPTAESLAQLQVMPQMGAREYAGAWAYMYLMLEDVEHGRPLLRAYLASLGQGTPADALWSRMPPVTVRELKAAARGRNGVIDSPIP
jgi:hypothetical protein